ncbi:MAG: putative toxin-antitoxin system toxin component, PIN family [Methylococcales bacterium]
MSLISSPALFAELADVLGRAKFAAILTGAGRTREHLLDEMRQLLEMVSPKPLPVPVCRDPDDDAVLAAALAAKADLIVSGDADLLALHDYQGIPIVTAAEALRIMDAQA